jgi:hypothetical protein
MADIDVEGDAQRQIEDAAKQHGGTISNFDASKLITRADPPDYDPPSPPQAKIPRQIWSEVYRNCTRITRTEHIVTTQRTASTLSVELDARLKLGRSMSVQDRIIETLLLGGSISIEIDLRANTKFTKSWEVSKTIDEVTPVPPCTDLTVAIVESGAA